VSKSRVEAFSDGVIAIAITLLVLDINVPAPGGGASLASRLGDQWPSYVAYVVSFMTIGIIWVNHHAMLNRIARVTHGVLMLNLLLLLWIGVLPWSTSLFAEYLREDRGQHLAAAVYAGTLLGMAVTFFAMQTYILSARRAVAGAEIGPELRADIIRRNRVGLLPYAVALAAAPLSSYVTLAICGAVALFYALPRTTADDLV
jgi:uncharacterized membrane protein